MANPKHPAEYVLPTRTPAPPVDLTISDRLGIVEPEDKRPEYKTSDSDDPDDVWIWRLFVHAGTDLAYDDSGRVKGSQGVSVLIPLDALAGYMARSSRHKAYASDGIQRWPRKRNACRLVNAPIVGGVYWICQTEPRDGSYSSKVTGGSQINPAKYVGRLDDEDIVARLYAEDRASRDHLTTAKTSNKERNRNLIRERLAPLAATMQGLNGRQRAQFLADVVQYLTTHKIDDRPTF